MKLRARPLCSYNDLRGAHRTPFCRIRISPAKTEMSLKLVSILAISEIGLTAIAYNDRMAPAPGTPEARARENIDKQLIAAGWAIVLPSRIHFRAKRLVRIASGEAWSEKRSQAHPGSDEIRSRAADCAAVAEFHSACGKEARSEDGPRSFKRGSPNCGQRRRSKR
jgi:hypothetical protein